jgi:hypothetical protein
MDMEQPFAGLIRISYGPPERALDEVQR